MSLISGAKKARGTTVIIDVFRAFSTAAYVIGKGAERIIPVGDLRTAFKLKNNNPEWILMGERNGKRIEGFDFGNSPAEIINVNFSDKTVIHTTSSGTQGVASAKRATVLILGSFVTAEAIVNFVLQTNPKIVSLVAMGDGGVQPAIEDELCAEYLAQRIAGEDTSFQNIKEQILQSPSSMKFMNPDYPQFREEDLRLCLELDRFDFFVRGERRTNSPWFSKEFPRNSS